MRMYKYCSYIQLAKDYGSLFFKLSDFDLICWIYIPSLFSEDSQDSLNTPIKMHDTLDENENN